MRRDTWRRTSTPSEGANHVGLADRAGSARRPCVVSVCDDDRLHRLAADVDGLARARTRLVASTGTLRRAYVLAASCAPRRQIGRQHERLRLGGVGRLPAQAEERAGRSTARPGASRRRPRTSERPSPCCSERNRRSWMPPPARRIVSCARGRQVAAQADRAEAAALPARDGVRPTRRAAAAAVRRGAARDRRGTRPRRRRAARGRSSRRVPATRSRHRPRRARRGRRRPGASGGGATRAGYRRRGARPPTACRRAGRGSTRCRPRGRPPSPAGGARWRRRIGALASSRLAPRSTDHISGRIQERRLAVVGVAAGGDGVDELPVGDEPERLLGVVDDDGGADVARAQAARHLAQGRRAGTVRMSVVMTSPTMAMANLAFGRSRSGDGSALIVDRAARRRCTSCRARPLAQVLEQRGSVMRSSGAWSSVSTLAAGRARRRACAPRWCAAAARQAGGGAPGGRGAARRVGGVVVGDQRRS